MAVDVARALGFNVEKGIGKYLSAVEKDERRVIELPTPGRIGGKGPVTVFAESGLYALISRSDKPEAKVFQRWVNRTVLPSIRKTGGYLLNEGARATAAADTREAMPLPMDIAEAMANAMKPVVAELASLKALLAATLEQRESAALDELKRNQMFLARDLQKRGIGRGLNTGEAMPPGRRHTEILSVLTRGPSAPRRGNLSA